MFRWKRKSEPSRSVLYLIHSDDGIVVTPTEPGRLLEDGSEVATLCLQLTDDGFARKLDTGWLISWSHVYSAMEHPAYAIDVQLLGLPPIGSSVPTLESHGSLIDSGFTISIREWRTVGGEKLSVVNTTGPMVTLATHQELMPRNTWELVRHLSEFRDRPTEQRNEASTRREWGRIRELAINAGARLDAFLYQTVVLTPEKLNIDLRRTHAAGASVVEVQPSFKNCPTGWIDQFDRLPSVADRYDIPTEHGIVQVIVTPQVRTVLAEIKRMPGRRVAGTRAEAFLSNPFAALGADAAAVIDPEQFESARLDAGIRFETFIAHIVSGIDGWPEEVGINIEVSGIDGAASESERRLFAADRELRQFINDVQNAISKGNQYCFWNEYEFEITGNTPHEVDLLKAALEARQKPRIIISYEWVYDLSRYSSRIEGIGADKPYYSPYIAKKNDDEGWWPENIAPVICWTPDDGGAPVILPVDDSVIQTIGKKVGEAEASGASEIYLSGTPKPMPVAEARLLLEAFKAAKDKAAAGTLRPDEVPSRNEQQRPSLIAKPNIQRIDHAEARREALTDSSQPATIPDGLRQDVSLLEHQEAGVAWLQHLYALAPDACRGAVLADDMGLGKTLQILAFICSVFEHEPSAEPALVVAPLSLLENWKEEAARFFKDGALPILTAHGTQLSSLRVPRTEIDSQLRDQGLVRFLKPGWRGGSRIVLTTYETLRDLEFSFATESWSIMVCDEAQKIKNPNAMVTRAAKKLKVRFRIACTGTPVENSLADLWCLFDFVQPGLLGALNDFGQRYRRPIEAKTDDERRSVEELRERIRPQILRRTKAEVAKDLKRKVEVQDCKKLELSAAQRVLYSKAIDQFQRRHQGEGGSPFKNHLTLLHYLRVICTDPRHYGTGSTTSDPLPVYRSKAPKLDWLLRTLSDIRDKEEKAIIFCEFREMQRMLRHYIEESFGFAPDVINGDTNAGGAADGRQARLRTFQERPGFSAIILSPVAVGFGVNIQAANHVIHYTRTWNPAKEDQATDRAYRIGQTKDVHVYCPVVRADDFKTFDVRLDELLTWKRSLANDMLNGTGDISPGEFNLEEVAPPDTHVEPAPFVDQELLSRLDPTHFEGLMAVLCQKQGYTRVALTPPSGDDGVDVVAICDSNGLLVQCKSSSVAAAEVGWEAVKDVVGGAAAYSMRYPKIRFRKVCATNRQFNNNAKRHAELNDVELIEESDLLQLLSAYPVRLSEIQSLLYSDWKL